MIPGKVSPNLLGSLRDAQPRFARARKARDQEGKVRADKLHILGRVFLTHFSGFLHREAQYRLSKIPALEPHCFDTFSTHTQQLRKSRLD